MSRIWTGIYNWPVKSSQSSFGNVNLITIENNSSPSSALLPVPGLKALAKLPSLAVHNTAYICPQPGARAWEQQPRQTSDSHIQWLSNGHTCHTLVELLQELEVGCQEAANRAWITGSLFLEMFCNWSSTTPHVLVTLVMPYCGVSWPLLTQLSPPKTCSASTYRDAA